MLAIGGMIGLDPICALKKNPGSKLPGLKGEYQNLARNIFSLRAIFTVKGRCFTAPSSPH